MSSFIDLTSVYLPHEIPSRPNNVRASDIATNYLTLTWDAITADNGNLAIQQFDLATEAWQNVYTDIAKEETSKVISQDFNGNQLGAGKQYRFRVVAVLNWLSSDYIFPSLPVPVTMQAAPPEAPTDLTIVSQSSDGFTINFTNHNLGSEAFNLYAAYSNTTYGTNNDVDYTWEQISLTAGEYTLTVPPATADTFYFIYLVGNTSPSFTDNTYISSKIVVLTASANPSMTDASTSYDGTSATLSWTNNNELAEPHQAYQKIARLINGQTWQSQTVVLDNSATTHTWTDLSVGVQYYSSIGYCVYGSTNLTFNENTGVIQLP